MVLEVANLFSSLAGSMANVDIAGAAFSVRGSEGALGRKAGTIIQQAKFQARAISVHFIDLWYH